MFVDVEETLGRELREVAEDLHVPALPSLPQEPARAPRHWQPLLVAAAVVLILAGAVTLVATTRGGQEPQPAPPSPSRTDSVERIPRTAPTVPYVLDQQLYVDGEQVPGTWWSVQSGEAGWLAQRTDYTWWWGRGPTANAIEGQLDVPPVLSPNGEYVGEVVDDNGQGVLSGFDTGFSGEGLGGVPVDLGSRADGSTVSVRAVTDDGRVIAQGTKTAVLWLPLVDNSTVDLTEDRTGPGDRRQHPGRPGRDRRRGRGALPGGALRRRRARPDRVGPSPRRHRGQPGRHLAGRDTAGGHGR